MEFLNENAVCSSANGQYPWMAIKAGSTKSTINGFQNTGIITGGIGTPKTQLLAPNAGAVATVIAAVNTPVPIANALYAAPNDNFPYNGRIDTVNMGILNNRIRNAHPAAAADANRQPCFYAVSYSCDITQVDAGRTDNIRTSIIMAKDAGALELIASRVEHIINHDAPTNFISGKFVVPDILNAGNAAVAETFFFAVTNLTDGRNVIVKNLQVTVEQMPVF